MKFFQLRSRLGNYTLGVNDSLREYFYCEDVDLTLPVKEQVHRLMTSKYIRGRIPAGVESSDKWLSGQGWNRLSFVPSSLGDHL